VNRQLRRRFWVEVGLAVLCAFLFALAVVWPDWIEAVSGASPDGGDGTLERALALAPLVVAVATAALARAEWRRLRATA
jgi:hypothetical protein